jgi:hypothetical protein
MRGNYGEKARAAVLAFVMVTSVTVGTVALSGGATAHTTGPQESGGVAATPADPGQTDRVQISNVSLVPETVDSNATEEHELAYTVTDASADGDSDTHTITLPDSTTISSTTIDSVTDANGDEIPVSSSASLADADGGTDNQVSFAIQPDSSFDTSSVTVDATITVDFPNVASDTTAAVTIGVSDSDRGTTNATTSVTVRAAPMASVTIDNGTSDGTEVTVDSVTLSDGGYVAIHSTPFLPDDGVASDTVIGVSDVLANGTTENVTVDLFEGVPGASFERAALSDDETVVAMPHQETNGDTEFDFVPSGETEDGPYFEDGSPVTDSATVTVSDEGPVAEQVSIENVTLSPAMVEANTTNEHTLTVGVQNVSDDGNSDTVTFTFPTDTYVSANVSAVDANGDTVTVDGVDGSGDAVAVEGADVSGDAVEGIDGSRDTATVDVAPDSNATTRDLTVTVNATVAAPSVTNATDAAIRIDVSDSSNGQASANATLTVQPVDGTDSPLDLVQGDDTIGFPEVLGVIEGFNGDGTYSQDGRTVQVSFPEVLGVIEAFNARQ